MTPIIDPIHIPLIRISLTDGIENTEQLLLIHDRDLGRTTRKNMNTAAKLESQIHIMRTALNMLPSP